MTATELNLLDALYAAVERGDTDSLLPLADALEEMGRGDESFAVRFGYENHPGNVIRSRDGTFANVTIDNINLIVDYLEDHGFYVTPCDDNCTFSASRFPGCFVCGSFVLPDGWKIEWNTYGGSPPLPLTLRDAVFQSDRHVEEFRKRHPRGPFNRQTVDDF